MVSQKERILSQPSFIRGKLLVLGTHTIYVWYIYLHLVDFYGKCS